MVYSIVMVRLEVFLGYPVLYPNRYLTYKKKARFNVAGTVCRSRRTQSLYSDPNGASIFAREDSQDREPQLILDFGGTGSTSARSNAPVNAAQGLSVSRQPERVYDLHGRVVGIRSAEQTTGVWIVQSRGHLKAHLKSAKIRHYALRSIRLFTDAT
jgi:hypothetical protein